MSRLRLRRRFTCRGLVLRRLTWLSVGLMMSLVVLMCRLNMRRVMFRVRLVVRSYWLGLWICGLVMKIFEVTDTNWIAKRAAVTAAVAVTSGVTVRRVCG